MDQYLKFFFIKLGTLIVLTPLIGYGLLRFFEYMEKVWKSGNRRNKWLMMCLLGFILAVIGGYLQ